MTATLRQGRPADIEELLVLWEALMDCGHTADRRFVPADGARPVMRDYMRSWFDPPPPFPPVWMAEVDGEAVGFVRGFPLEQMPVVQTLPTVRIGDLYVADAHRREGIGRRLVSRMLQSARAAGYADAVVGTLAKDHRAVAFWRSMGFGDYRVMLHRELGRVAGADHTA